MKIKLLAIAIIAILMFSDYPVFAQSALFSRWAVLSENASNASLKDTTFMDVKCVKLDGQRIAAIWDKMANYKDFRMDFDMAGSVMAGIGFLFCAGENNKIFFFLPGL